MAFFSNPHLPQTTPLPFNQQTATQIAPQETDLRNSSMPNIPDLPNAPRDEHTRIQLKNDNMSLNNVVSIHDKQKSITKLEGDKDTKPEFNKETFEYLKEHGLLSDNLEISGFKITGNLDLPEDINITFSNCEFEEGSVIYSNSQILLIENCTINKGCMLNSYDPTAEIVISNTKFPDKDDVKDKSSVDAVKNSFIIDGVAKSLEIQDSSGILTLTSLRLEDKNCNPKKVIFKDENKKIINSLTDITSKYRIITPKKYIQDKVIAEWNTKNEEKRLTEIDKKKEDLKRKEEEYIQMTKEKREEKPEKKSFFAKLFTRHKDNDLENDPLLKKYSEIKELHNEILQMETKDDNFSPEIPKLNKEKNGLIYEQVYGNIPQRRSVPYNNYTINEEDQDNIKNFIFDKNKYNDSPLHYTRNVETNQITLENLTEEEPITKVIINRYLQEIKDDGINIDECTISFKGYNISNEMLDYLTKDLGLNIGIETFVNDIGIETFVNVLKENFVNSIDFSLDDNNLTIELQNGNTEFPLEIFEKLKNCRELSKYNITLDGFTIKDNLGLETSSDITFKDCQISSNQNLKCKNLTIKDCIITEDGITINVGDNISDITNSITVEKLGNNTSNSTIYFYGYAEELHISKDVEPLIKASHQKKQVSESDILIVNIDELKTPTGHNQNSSNPVTVKVDS